MRPDVAVAVDGLRVGYGDRVVLDDISLEVPSGSITVVVGPSGCGKTTLLRALAGLEPVRAGRIEIGGTVVTGDGVHVPPERRRLGLVPQDGALFGHLSVAGNVGFGLGPWWHRQPGRAQRIDDLLEVVGLTELRQRRPSTLSGGQRQRVALARALAPRPEVIGLDEPFSALDADLRVRLRGHVRDTILAEGATGLLVTHDREEAMAMADVVVVLIGGRIRQSGPPQEVYTEPRDVEVARLFGDVAVLPATAEERIGRSAVGPLALRRAGTGEGSVLIRPRDLALTVPGADGAEPVSATPDSTRDVPGDGLGSAVVTAVRSRGDDVVVSVDVDGTGLLLAADPDVPVRPGELVGVEQRRPVHFLPRTAPGVAG
ncbi:ABC transporter ATP-binding protein [Gordonia sinesedis]